MKIDPGGLRRSALQMWKVQIPASDIFFYMCRLDCLWVSLKIMVGHHQKLMVDQ